MFQRYNITSTEDQKAALNRAGHYHQNQARTAAQTNADTATGGTEKL
jgi:hypothetical protein